MSGKKLTPGEKLYAVLFALGMVAVVAIFWTLVVFSEVGPMGVAMTIWTTCVLMPGAAAMVAETCNGS